jgi:hypothetical protein
MMHERQNAYLTFKANSGVGRHGWLRLTPAYSVRLVREHVAALSADSVVVDPFSGTGTTALAAAEHGCHGQSLDINPFLIWLGNVKLRNYGLEEIDLAKGLARSVLVTARENLGDRNHWQPRLHNIDRWWDGGALSALKALRSSLDSQKIAPQTSLDLLDIAFCRTLISSSNAAFNHQSMSFREDDSRNDQLDFDFDHSEKVLHQYAHEASVVLESASHPLPGAGQVLLGDAREMDTPGLAQCNLLFTSPPYANRMSYIRELRPYMYWLRHLDLASDAGDLDWHAIGGTWGTATSRLLTWRPVDDMPLRSEICQVRDAMIRDGGKNGPLLANYVDKYFTDMWDHFQAAFKHVVSGGRATYVIGNSTFYGHLVPSEQWYADLLREAGFVDVTIKPIRKRNSNKALYEYEVSARRP